MELMNKLQYHSGCTSSIFLLLQYVYIYIYIEYFWKIFVNYISDSL